MRKFTQNINLPIVLRVLGWLLMIEGVYMLLPLCVSACYGEETTLRAFLYSALITVGTGAVMAFCIHPKNLNMGSREGLLLTAIIWAFFSAFGMLPFLFSGVCHSVANAYFETMSGFTTTGATILDDLSAVPHGLLFWRSATQWLGGMGIILFTLAVVPMLNSTGGIALFNAEVTGITHDRMRPRVSQTAKDLWFLYIGMTVVLTLLLMKPMGFFDAICQALATISTGGFSTKADGLNYWHSYYIDSVVMLFMFLGGVNFTLLFGVTRGRFKPLRHNDTFKWYFMIVVVASVVIILRMTYENFCDDWSDRIVYAIFDTISAITSTGFSTIDYEASGEFISLILMLCMLVGGMAGSTAGGAKVDRLIVMLKNTKNSFYKVLHPNAVMAVRIDGRSLNRAVVAKVVAFFSVYMIALVVGAVVMTAYDVPMFDSLFTSMSALSNVGFGYGVTGVDGSFLELPDAVKWMLSFEMMVGRLELFTVLVVFTPAFWLKE